jgi:hypothetical protein
MGMGWFYGCFIGFGLYGLVFCLRVGLSNCVKYSKDLTRQLPFQLTESSKGNKNILIKI